MFCFLLMLLLYLIFLTIFQLHLLHYCDYILEISVGQHSIYKRGGETRRHEDKQTIFMFLPRVGWGSFKYLLSMMTGEIQRLQRHCQAMLKKKGYSTSPTMRVATFVCTNIECRDILQKTRHCIYLARWLKHSSVSAGWLHEPKQSYLFMHKEQ